MSGAFRCRWLENPCLRVEHHIEPSFRCEKSGKGATIRLSGKGWTFIQHGG